MKVIHTRRAPYEGFFHTAKHMVFLIAPLAVALIGPSPATAGLGGEMLGSYPLLDTREGKQEAKAATVDGGGNIIVTGYQNLSGGVDDDYYTVKFNADGSGVAWRAIYNKANGSDVATAVVADTNGDIIVTGYVWNGVNKDIHTIKYSGANGGVLWQHTFNGTANGNDVATAVGVDDSNNVYVAGYSQNASGNDDFLILKYGPGGGAPAATEVYNAPVNGNDRIAALAVTASGVAVTGSSWNGTKFEVLTRKYDRNLALTREWRTGGVGAVGSDSGKAVALDAGGNVIVAATVANAADLDIYVAKLDPSSGTAVWQRTFNGGFDDEPKGVAVDASGDVNVTGYTWTLAGRYDFFTARYAGASGSVLWQRTYNSGGSNDDIPAAGGIAVDSDGAVYVTGTSFKTGDANLDILLLKYHRDSGNLLWQLDFDGAARKDDQAVGVLLPADRNPVVAGWLTRPTDTDYAILKYDKGQLFRPTGLTATATTDTSVALSWSDNSSDEESFVVERKLGEAGTWGAVTTVAANTASWTDSTVAANNYYFYRVKAARSGGIESLPSNEASVLTKVIAYTSPVWTFAFNGPDNREDYAESIAVGPDDNPVVTGRSELREAGVDPPAFSLDYNTIKINRADRSVLWNAAYDSGDGGNDVAKSVAVNSTNDVFVSGNAYLYWPGATDNTNDIFTIKYPASGPPETWHHQYNGPAGGDDRSTSVATAIDGSNNVAVVGYGINAANNADLYVMKLASPPTTDAGGNAVPLWAAAPYDGGGDDYPTAVAMDPTGNVFVAGYTKSGSFFKWYVAKYSSTTGSRVWTDVYGLGYGDDIARSIVVDSQGNAYVTGSATNLSGKKELRIIKYDGSASPATRRIWEKSGPGGGDDEGASVRIDPIDSAIVVAGTVLRTAGNHDLYLTRLNRADGAIIWERFFDRPANDDVVKAMAMDSSGYLYVAGTTNNGLSTDILSVIYDYSGTFLGAMVYNGSANDFDEAKDVTVNLQGEAFVAGYSINADGNADYVVLKQKNDYLLVPAPFTASGHADYSKMNLAWRSNSPGTGFHVWRTIGTPSEFSVWTKLPDMAPGTTSYVDSGLAADTTYCYRIDAFTGSLSSRTITACGTTTIAPPTVTATADSTAQITLSWGSVAGNTGYRVERKIGTGAWAEAYITAANATMWADTGLTAGGLYTYRVASRSAGGWSLASGEVAVTTNPVAAVVSAPTVVTTSQVTFSWTNVIGETGYKVERKTGPGGSWGEVATTAADVTTWTDNGVSANIQYYYRVRAVNGSGNSAYSNEVAVLTPLPPPTLSSASAVSTAQVNLVWSAVAGATGYTIQEASCSYSDSNPGYCELYDWAWNGWGQVGATTGATTFQRTGATPGYDYRYRVIATVSGTSSAPSNTLVAWTWLPSPVLNVAPATETSLSLSWNNQAGETNFTIERKLGTGGTWAAVPAGTNLAAGTVTFTDTGLSLQTSYCYRVYAFSTLSSAPPAAYSNEVCLTTPLPAPVLDPLVVSSSQINVSWANVANNTGYELERCSMNYPNQPEAVVTYNNADYLWSCSTPVPLPANTTAYTDTGLTAGYTYRYRIRDIYAGGTSGWSTMRYATTTPPAPAINSVTSVSVSEIDLNWSDGYGETSYKLEWKEGAGGTWNQVTLGENVWYFNHTGLKTGTTYYYRIRASNAWGDSGYSTEISRPTLLGAPTLNALTGITISRVDLSWNNISGNTGYKVQRKTGTDGPWVQIGTTAPDGAAYSDTTVAAGTLYYYRVIAVNSGGDSVSSNEQSTTTTPAKPTVTLSVSSSAGIDVSWGLVYGATTYKLQRKVTVAGTLSEIANLPITYREWYCGTSFPTVKCPTASPSISTYANTGLTENTQYCYRVVAWNATGGDSQASTEVCATTSAMAGPSLTATAETSMRVRLDWTYNPAACTPVACASPDGYEVELLLESGKWSRLATVPATTLTYADTSGIQPKKTYRYRVRAFKGLDKAAYGNTATVVMPAFSASDGTCP